MATYRQIETALRNAHAAGDTASATRLAQALQNKEYDEESNDLASFAQGVGQGATLGFSDEAAAGLRATLSPFIEPAMYAIGQTVSPSQGNEGKSMRELFNQFKGMHYGDGYLEGFGQRYDDALASQRGALETARREDPYMSMAGELGGGLLSGGAGMARAAAGRGIMSGTLRTAATGAGYGGVAGYGYGEGDVGRAALSGDTNAMLREGSEAIGDAGLGAATGGAFGVAAPIGFGGLKSLAKYITKPFTKDARFTEAGRRTVLQSLQDDIDAGHINLDDARRELANTPGMTIADLGPNLRAAAEDIMHSGTRAGVKTRAFYTDRNKAQWQRMYPELAKVLGRTSDNFHQAKQELLARSKNMAKELYDVAYAQPIRLTPEMRNILQAKAFGNVLKNADDLRHDALLAKGIKADDIQATDFTKAMQGTEEVDYIMRAMDARVSALYRSDNAAESALAAEARNLRNQFRDAVYSQNRYLQQARARWHSDRAVDEAMDQGRKIFNMDFDVVDDTVRNMSVGERNGFRIGVLRALTKRLGDKSDDADITKGLFNIDNKRKVLNTVFGGKKQFDEFLAYVKQEQKMFETYKGAMGSQTANRLQSSANLGAQLAALGGYAGGMSFGGALPPAITGYLTKRGYMAAQNALQRTPIDEARKQQARLLMGSDLGQVLNPSTIGGLMSPDLPVAPLRATGSLISGGILNPDVEYGGVR